MTAVSISQAREKLYPLVRQVSEDHTVVEIVARDGGNAVLMSAEDFESWQETVFLMSSPANAAHILAGLAEGRAGGGLQVAITELRAKFGIADDE